MEEKDIPKEETKKEETKIEETKEQPKEKAIEDKDKEAKQEFLRKELIDKGYNPEDFSNYVTGTTGFSTEETGLESFKNLIEQFKTEQLKKASDGVKDEFKDEDIVFDMKVFKPYSTSIQSVKQELSPISEKDKASVLINDPQRVEGGLFSSPYYTFQVACEAINSKTRRVFEDFEWLRLKLVATYPNVFVPPLIEKAFFDVNDIPVTLLRLRYLNRFMNIVMRKKVLRTSQLVHSFLTLTPEEFEAFKKKNKANAVYKSLEEYPTVKGQLNLNLTKETLVNAERIQMFIHPNVFLYEKLNEMLGLLMNDFTQTSIHMKEVSEIFNNLALISSKTSPGDTKKKAFTMFKDLTNQWAVCYAKQKEMFDYQIREFFDYIRREFNQFNDLVNDYNLKLKNFENYEIKLQAKKESLFNSKKYPKWEIVPQQGEVIDYPTLEKNKDAAIEKILPKETDISLKSKHLMTYSTQKMVKEYHRLMKYQDEKIMRLINNLEKHNQVLLGDATVLMNLIKVKIQ